MGYSLYCQASISLLFVIEFACLCVVVLVSFCVCGFVGSWACGSLGLLVCELLCWCVGVCMGFVSLRVCASV